ncbi:GNAT family N-acetyltransferase [uncultured Micrococcus sp.]|uniref:GNAT family N-acetyltransferase n=1 Tax=uncultured Micrococcus sp. TaxID=114051 RepID=UPI00345D695E
MPLVPGALGFGEAGFQHRACLQTFNCAALPLRQLKKTPFATRVDGRIQWSSDSGAWHSLVQGVIRDLRVPFTPPSYAYLAIDLPQAARIGECASIAGVVVWNDCCQIDGDTLRASLDLLGVDRRMARQGVGTAMVTHAIQACGSTARALGASTLIVTSVVHNNNIECQALLHKNGWKRTGRVPSQPDCSYWVISGSRGS